MRRKARYLKEQEEEGAWADMVSKRKLLALCISDVALSGFLFSAKSAVEEDYCWIASHRTEGTLGSSFRGLLVALQDPFPLGWNSGGVVAL